MELYKYFCEVARVGNVTKAAENLYISQPAVSQAIMQLEEKLGCKLFNRSKRGVKLTKEGEVFYSYASNAVSLIENAQEKVLNMRNLRDGEVKIGASDTVCSLFLLPFLDKFSAQYPEIRISVINRTTQSLIELVKNRTVDMSFVSLPIDDSSLLEITPVMQIKDCFVAGARYAHLADSVIRLRDLRKYPILMLDENSSLRKHMDMFFASCDLEIKPTIELESLSLLAEFAKIGLGIASTIKEDVQKLLDSQELYELRFLETFPKRHFGMAQLGNESLSFAAQAFKECVLTSGEG